MRSKLTASLAALAIFASTPALAADPPSKPAAPAAKPDKPKDAQVCTTETELGSLVPKRVCRSKAQIDAERAALDEMNRERRGSTSGQAGQPLVP